MKNISGKAWAGRLSQTVKGELGAIGVIAGFYLVLQGMGITCPVLFLTGVSCAGCGMSRAWLSLCRLDLTGAFHYHPLFWLPIPGAILLFFKRHMPKRWFVAMGTVMTALFLAVYLARMFTPQDNIVVFCPKEGFLYRVFAMVSGW